MCVLLCVNPQAREWIDLPLARAYRQTFQLCALRPDEPDFGAPAASSVEPLDKAAERRVMKRSAWLQAYCAHQARIAQRRSSPQEWHHAFDALAKAWGRLLALVGLRW
jgi:hypothetical protein